MTAEHCWHCGADKANLIAGHCYICSREWEKREVLEQKVVRKGLQYLPRWERIEKQRDREKGVHDAYKNRGTEIVWGAV